MPSLSDYTPLESLLFFQSIRSLGVESSSFNTISDSLNANRFVREHESYDITRLAPKALEDFYNELLRKELASHLDGDTTQNGHVNSRKRKLSTPPRTTAEDIPRPHRAISDLVNRLYARYRQLAIEEIRRQERTHDDLRREIQKLEDEGDNAAEKPAASTAVTRVNGSERQLRISDEILASPDVASGERPATETPTSINDGQAHVAVSTASNVGRLDPAVETPRPGDLVAPTRPRANLKSGVPQPALIASPSQPRVLPPHRAEGRSPSVSVPANSTLSFLPPPNQPHHSYPMPSPGVSPVRLPPSQTQAAHPANIAPVPSYSPVPSNATPRVPVILPPPPGLQLQAKSPTQQLGDFAGQQRGDSSASGPVRAPQYPSVPSKATQYPPPNYPPQPWPPHSSPSQQYAQHVSPYGNYYPQPQAAGRSLPPPGSHYQGPYQPMTQPASGDFAPQGTLTQQPYDPRAYQPMPYPARDQQQHVASTPLNLRTPQLARLSTSATSTPWRGSAKQASAARSRPSPEPPELSPSSERFPSPPLFEEEPKARGRPKSTRGRKSYKGNGHATPMPSVETKSARGQKSARGRGRGRASSSARSASSAMPGRSRSQSMLSHDDQAWTETGSLRGQKIKHEQPSTPAATTEEGDTELRSSGRRRRGTRGTHEESGLTNIITTKRKRGPRESIDGEDSPHLPPTIIPANASQVPTTRNFSRTCATIINDVTAHKFAGIFAKPLTERDAPGYKNLIYRPQDLKSIKSAIHHGNKAVITASENTVSTPSGDAGSPPASASTPSKTAVQLLTKTVDLIPPKGIVNSAQLEKELMRVFANAIMFNPNPERGFGPAFRMINDAGTVGPEGVVVGGADDEGFSGIVKDTREMFEHVEGQVAGWRAAEKGVEDFGAGGLKSAVSMRGGSTSDVYAENADETTSVAGDEGTGTVRKRRKVA